MLDSGIYAHGDLAGRVIASVDIIGTGDPKRTTPTDGTDPYGHGTPASVKSRLMFSADKEIDPSPFARSAGSLDLMAALLQKGYADSALSPLVFRSDKCCMIKVEDMG